jgi:alanine racemase
MNVFMVDLTDIPGVSLEDPVTLIGKSGRETITADDLAALCGTISYEIVSRISHSVPRLVVMEE